MKRTICGKPLVAFLLIVISLCLILGGCAPSKGGMTTKDYEEVTNPNATTPGTATIPPKTLVENPINFDELTKKNSDLYAWLEIPDTKISYPVAQSSNSDDNYYLHHNYLGNYEFAGTIYSQRHNSKYFADPVTVLYGHNMLNGTMFADLHKFADEKFFEEHETMYIYIDNYILTYQIFAAYEYDDRHILNSFDFADDKIFEYYLEQCLNPRSSNSNVREGVTLDVDDKILTLSTCTDYNSSMRYLVQGVLINEQETY